MEPNMNRFTNCRHLRCDSSIGWPPAWATSVVQLLLFLCRSLNVFKKGEIIMNMRQRIAGFPPLMNVMRIPVIGAIVACIAGSVPSLAIAQQAGTGAEGGVPAFARGMIDHMQAMRRFKDPDQSVQQTP